MTSGIMGSGDFAYRAQDGWAKWPDGWDSGDVAYVSFSRSFPDTPKPARIRCLQKLVQL